MSVAKQALLAVEEAPLVKGMAESVNLDSKRYFATIKAICGCRGAQDEHFYALLIACQKYDLDPMMKQLYLIQTKNGPRVVVPIDGYLLVLHRHPDYLTHEVRMHFVEGEGGKVDYAEARVWKKSLFESGFYEKNDPPTWHREYMVECYKPPVTVRPSGGGQPYQVSGPWQTHPRRMLRHKAMSQAVRYELGFYIPDEDEIVDIPPASSGPSVGRPQPEDTRESAQEKPERPDGRPEPRGSGGGHDEAPPTPAPLPALDLPALAPAAPQPQLAHAPREGCGGDHGTGTPCKDAADYVDPDTGDMPNAAPPNDPRTAGVVSPAQEATVEGINNELDEAADEQLFGDLE